MRFVEELIHFAWRWHDSMLFFGQFKKLCITHSTIGVWARDCLHLNAWNLTYSDMKSYRQMVKKILSYYSPKYMVNRKKRKCDRWKIAKIRSRECAYLMRTPVLQIQLMMRSQAHNHSWLTSHFPWSNDDVLPVGNDANVSRGLRRVKAAPSNAMALKCFGARTSNSFGHDDGPWFFPTLPHSHHSRLRPLASRHYEKSQSSKVLFIEDLCSRFLYLFTILQSKHTQSLLLPCFAHGRDYVVDEQTIRSGSGPITCSV